MVVEGHFAYAEMSR